jgi:hypothetical protein
MMVKVKLKTGHEIYLDGLLINALDSLVYNVKSDWDFIIIITGDRMVRTGKSVLGINICSYLADKLNTPYNLDNIFFDSSEMIAKAQAAPKHSLLHYDEGREGLAASKSGKQMQKDLLDYFEQCGQLNHIFVIVISDFFELKERIAVGRSECLINVYRKEKEIEIDMYKDGVKRPVVRFERGYFEFFNRNRKRDLYDKSRTTKRKNYGIIKANFVGRFTNNYGVIDEDAYKKKKSESLAKFEEKKKDEEMESRQNIVRNKVILELDKEGLKPKEIIKRLEERFGITLGIRRIYEILQKLKSEKS